MKKIDIYNRFKEAYDGFIKEARKHIATIDKANGAIASNRYSDQVNKDKQNEIFEAQSAMNALRLRFEKELDAIEAQTMEDIAALDNIVPSDLVGEVVEVIRLAKDGMVTLTARELDAMIDSNAGNRTMCRIIGEYVKQNKIKVSNQHLVDVWMGYAEELKKYTHNIYYSFNIAKERSVDASGLEKYYDLMVGEESPAYKNAAADNTEY